MIEISKNIKIRVLIATVISIVVTMFLTYLIGIIFGLIGATLVMLLSLTTLWYLSDYYGDFLFKEKISKKAIDSYKRGKFPYLKNL